MFVLPKGKQVLKIFKKLIIHKFCILYNVLLPLYLVIERIGQGRVELPSYPLWAESFTLSYCPIQINNLDWPLEINIFNIININLFNIS